MHTNPNFPIGLNSINQALIEMQQQQKQFHDENIHRMKQIHKKMDDAFDKLINSLLEGPDAVENNDIQADEVESEIAIEADAVKEYEEFHTIALAAPHPQLKLQTEVTCVNPVSVDYSQVLFLSKGETEVCIGEPNSESSVYGMNSLKSWCSLGVRLNVAVGFSSNTADPDSEIGRQNHYSGLKNVEVIRLELSNQCVSPWIICDDEYVDVWLLPGNGLSLSIRLCMLGVCKNVPMKFYYFDANFLSLMEHQNGWSKSGAPLRLTWLAKPPPRPPDVYINIATSRATNGAMTLEQMNVSNHIAKLIVWLSWIQDSEIGNATTEIDGKYINLESIKIVGFNNYQNSGLLYVSRKIENYKRRWELFPHGHGSITITLSWEVICKLSSIVTPNHGTVDFESLLKLQDSHVGRMIEGGTNELLTWKMLLGNSRMPVFKLSSKDKDRNEEASECRVTIKTYKLTSLVISASWAAYQDYPLPRTIHGILSGIINAILEDNRASAILKPHIIGQYIVLVLSASENSGLVYATNLTGKPMIFNQIGGKEYTYLFEGENHKMWRPAATKTFNFRHLLRNSYTPKTWRLDSVYDDESSFVALISDLFQRITDLDASTIASDLLCEDVALGRQHFDATINDDVSILGKRLKFSDNIVDELRLNEEVDKAEEQWAHESGENVKLQSAVTLLQNTSPLSLEAALDEIEFELDESSIDSVLRNKLMCGKGIFNWVRKNQEEIVEKDSSLLDVKIPNHLISFLSNWEEEKPSIGMKYTRSSEILDLLQMKTTISLFLKLCWRSSREWAWSNINKILGEEDIKSSRKLYFTADLEDKVIFEAPRNVAREISSYLRVFRVITYS